jgi:hypothetical protein
MSSTSHQGPGSFPHIPRAPLPTTVLLTTVAPCLRTSGALREWLGHGGGYVPRSLQCVGDPNGPGTALVTLPHAEAAAKLVAAIRHNHTDSHNHIGAHLVPVNPDIPLPPALVDPETTQTLAQALRDSLHKITRYGPSTDVTTPALAPTLPERTPDASLRPAVEPHADPEDEDPLTSPAVLNAVKAFRDQLEVQQGTKATRRKALVAQTLAQVLPAMRLRRQQEPSVTHAPTPTPLPPAAIVPTPTTTTLPVPPPPPLPAQTPPAPRGVSNLPAWMTQANLSAEPPTASATEPPPSKRPKLDTAQPFPALPPAAHAPLRDFVTAQIQHYLGEAETSLIELIVQFVLRPDGEPAQGLLPELDVLEDDAHALLQALWDHTQHLATA